MAAIVRSDSHANKAYVVVVVDWLFSCNDRALLAWCPRHIQSVSNLMVDILMDIHVMVN